MRKIVDTWILFAACAAVLVTALWWLSLYVLRFDNGQASAKIEADREEKIRLALWRMDSALASIVWEENTRAVDNYASNRPTRPAWMSPLRSLNATNLTLHFEFGPDRVVRTGEIASEHPPGMPVASALSRLQGFVRQASATTLMGMVNNTNDVELLNASQPLFGQRLTPHEKRSQVEQQQRAESFLNAYSDINPIPVNPSPKTAPGVNPMTPGWIGDDLVLLRQVDSRPQWRIQGCWINWPAIRRQLLYKIRDLLPRAELAPVKQDNGEPSYRRLTALPPIQIQLIPGDLPAADAPLMSATRMTLLFAWFAVVLVAVAVALMLHGAITLSERRAAFVSAVTHELRTPMTTFKLYSEMLADGMVQDEDQRQRYLQTLCAESNRLGHLVENVLAYSRLERGSARSRVERLTLRQLLDRLFDRLSERAEQAEMRLIVDTESTTSQVVVHVDATAVEHILFNLVDNACKYAAPCSTVREIHIEALPESGKFAMLRVRDHGQGIASDVQRRLFEPFCKSADEAAQSGPGVGLGLALCRRLSRSMGGDLTLDRRIREGAAFLLQLPIAASRREPSLT
jgi:signal transduction histidine kinase